MQTSVYWTPNHRADICSNPLHDGKPLMMFALIIDEMIYLYCNVCKKKEGLPLMTTEEWWALEENNQAQGRRINPTFVEEAEIQLLNNEKEGK
jgi:hypothetical protein